MMQNRGEWSRIESLSASNVILASQWRESLAETSPERRPGSMSFRWIANHLGLEAEAVWAKLRGEANG